jgi:4-hydroxy-tetrahydrodipicolinate reductase
LGAECDVSLVEAHRRGKRDAPSGTALQLAQAVNQAGATVEREQIHAVRGGDVFGEHTVRFALPGEYLEISHRATQIDVFARGALRAAAWLRGRSPGRYGMSDVLGGAA